MVIGTVFTLFVVPSFYMLIAKQRSAVRDEAEVESFEDQNEPELVGV
jgi:hypothetical protein